MTPLKAELTIAYWAQRLGVGFHPDTPSYDYDPPLDEPGQYESDMTECMAVLGSTRFYEACYEASRVHAVNEVLADLEQRHVEAGGEP